MAASAAVTRIEGARALNWSLPRESWHLGEGGSFCGQPSGVKRCRFEGALPWHQRIVKCEASTPQLRIRQAAVSEVMRCGYSSASRRTDRSQPPTQMVSSTSPVVGIQLAWNESPPKSRCSPSTLFSLSFLTFLCDPQQLGSPRPLVC
ncbi:hypothetical protein NDU88_008872 [Pleurodeles waltl]|uniref:Uncharacterized protein n=1 Tax=Pleurodeles waltl TaxID=8319 RepID=A0AAV7P6A6_PLEWA|nr:hypothetical protein NDU88_008872 [Pleurodeles waltl]